LTRQRGHNFKNKDMKTAIYIENGVTQLVLTPENDWEKQVIGCIEEGGQSVKITRGSFYECRGGWNRMGIDETSLIIRTSIKSKDVNGCEIELV